MSRAELSMAVGSSCCNTLLPHEGLAGMNSASVSNALLPPDMDGIKLVSSADELGDYGDGRTWVIFHPLRDQHVVAWSPCDGMKLRLPEEVVADPSCGGRLVLAPNSVFTIGLDYRVVVDSRGIEAFVMHEDDHVDAVFSSITGVWELTEEEEEESIYECISPREQLVLCTCSECLSSQPVPAFGTRVPEKIADN